MEEDDLVRLDPNLDEGTGASGGFGRHHVPVTSAVDEERISVLRRDCSKTTRQAQTRARVWPCDSR